MAGGHFNGFQVARFDDDGRRIVMPNETLDVVNAVSNASLGTVETDEFGNVADGVISEDAGETVEFSLDGYAGIFQRKLAGSSDDAYLLEENLDATFVVENLYTETDEATYAEIWAEDLTDPNVPDQFIGYGVPGTTPTLPMPTNDDHIYRIYLQSVTRSGRRAFTRYKQGASQMVTAASATGIPDEVDPNLVFAGPPQSPAANPTFRRLKYADLPPLRRTLWDISAAIPNTGIGTEAIWTYTVPAGTLANDGDKIEMQFAVSAPTIDNIRFGVVYAGTYVIATRNQGDPALQGTHIVRGWIMRTSPLSVRTAFEIVGSDASANHYIWTENWEYGGDFDADFDLQFEVEDGTAGNIVIESGYGEYVPLANPDFDPPTVGELTATAQDDTSILWELEEGTDPLL